MSQTISYQNVGLALLLSILLWFVPSILLSTVGVDFSPTTGFLPPISYAFLTLRKSYQLESQEGYVLGSALTGLLLGLLIVAIDVLFVQQIDMSLRFSLITIFEHLMFATLGGWLLYWSVKRRMK